jgi:hypothetical protein
MLLPLLELLLAVLRHSSDTRAVTKERIRINQMLNRLKLTMGCPVAVEGPIRLGMNMLMSPPREPSALSKALSMAFSS